MKNKTCVAALAFALVVPFQSKAVDGFAVEAGGGNGVDVVRAGAQWNWDKKWLDNGALHLGGYWDAQIGRWHGASSITDLSLTPTFRYQQSSGKGAYFEGAIGFHYLSGKNVTAAKQLSTNFTFGDHIGAGYRFGDRGQYDLGVRLQHLSNAGIKHPNPAVNFALVRFQYWF